MAEIRFTATKSMLAYLTWLSRTVIPRKTPSEVAEYLVTRQIEKMRRKHWRDEPSFEDDGKD